jgi:hypothetical protein
LSGSLSGVSVSLQSASTSPTPIERKTVTVTQGKEKFAAPYTYYVGKSNGWRLLKDALDRRGWQQLPFEYSFSSRFNLKWVERRSQIDYRAHTAGQLVNHIPNNDCISTKLGLLTTLREKYCRVSADSTVRKPTPWLPETYQLDSPADVIAAFEIDDKLLIEKRGGPIKHITPVDKGNLVSLTEDKENNATKVEDMFGEIVTVSQSVAEAENGGCLWIYKPSCNNRGRGIRVLQGKKALELICYGKQTGDPLTTFPPSQGILQRYIENPLLAEGCKFDVRCYMLIACNDPSCIAYYHSGYCRLSLKPYSSSLESLEDPTVHLTNASIQKKDPLYELNKEKQVQYSSYQCCDYY